MKAVIQRVSSARVRSNGRPLGEIGPGLVVLLGIADGDGEDDLRWLATKTASLRIFEDSEGKMNLSVTEAGGAALVVSQFTLLADCRKGRRPSFVGAAAPERGRDLYERFVGLLREQGLHVETGSFGAKMLVSIDNDGPVTILLDSSEAGRRRARGGGD